MKSAIVCAGLVIVMAAVPALAQEEEEQKEPAWAGDLGLSYLATTGNTDTQSFGLDFKLDRKPQPWGFELRANFTRAEDSDVLTAERYFAGARALRALSERWDLWAGLSFEQDVFAGFDLRTLVGAGATYKALRGPKHLLNIEGGLSWTDEDRVEPEPDASFTGGILGLDYEFKLSDTSSLTQLLTLYPNFEDSADWRVFSETGLQAAVYSKLAVKLSYELRYRNEPIGDAKATDTTSKVSLVYAF
jgi:putative salt-induced outer membrane protein